MTHGTKPWWQSATIWSSIIGAVFALAAAFGVLPEGLDAEAVVGAILTLTSAAAIIFRVKATAEISTPTP